VDISAIKKRLQLLTQRRRGLEKARLLADMCVRREKIKKERSNAFISFLCAFEDR
jgi:hypothetical protein